MKLLLFDIGNTHTHLGLTQGKRMVRHINLATAAWSAGSAPQQVRDFVGATAIDCAALCSVVPGVTSHVWQTVRKIWKLEALVLTPQTIRGVGIHYPKPNTIGPDRLANAVAVHQQFGAPAVVVDFGTAVTFDVVNAQGNYVGGIIAPGLAAMTDYLHEKTAMLPRIKIQETHAVIGRNTQQAMLIGAVHGYRGLVRELISQLKAELRCRRLPVVATGGYARLMAARLPEITAVEPLLTLTGLRLVWDFHFAKGLSPAGTLRK